MLTKNRQKGFAAVQIILIIIALGLVGFTGYFVYSANKRTSDTLNEAGQVAQSSSPKFSQNKTAKKATTTPKTTMVTPSPAPDKKYLMITEWSVKVDLGSADPSLISYSLTGPTDDVAGPILDSAVLKLKSSVTSDVNCQNLGVSITKRSSKVSDNDIQLGSYWYGVSGSPASCGNKTLDVIRQQYSGNNVFNWKYLSIQ